MEKLIMHSGRPLPGEGKRLEKEERVYDLLDGLGVPYGRIDHEHADTMEACLAIDEALDCLICKNLFLANRQGTQFYLLMMPGDKVFKTKELSPQLGVARLSFGSGEKMEEYLDITPGSVSVLGLMNDHENRVQLVVDEDVRGQEFFGCHPCINTSSLKLRISDLFEKILPAIGHEPVFVQLEGRTE